MMEALFGLVVVCTNLCGDVVSEAVPLYNNQHMLNFDWVGYSGHYMFFGYLVAWVVFPFSEYSQDVVTTAFLKKFPDANLKYVTRLFKHAAQLNFMQQLEVKSVETVNRHVCFDL